MALRSRRTGTKLQSNQKPSLIQIRVGDSHEIAQRTLKSLESCYKICILSVVTELFCILVNEDIYSKIFGSHALLWTDFIDVIDSLLVFTFGLGVGKLCRLYRKMLNNPNEHMSDADATKVLRTMAVLWTTSVWCLETIAVGNAAALSAHIEGSASSHAFESMTTSRCVIFVLAYLGFANVIILMYCRGRVAIAKARNEGIRQIDILKVIRTEPVFKSAEYRIAYRATLSQALCVGSYSAIAILKMIIWIVEQNSIIGRLLSASDVMAPFAMTYLIFILNRSFLRVFLFGKLQDSKLDEADVRNSMFQSQARFYDQVTDIIKGLTIVKVVPYVALPVRPYVMNMIEQYAPKYAQKFSELLDEFV